MCRKEGRGVVGLSLRINALIKDVIFHKVICLNYICPCCSFKIFKAKLKSCHNKNWFFFLIDNKCFIDEKEQCVYDCKLTALEHRKFTILPFYVPSLFALLDINQSTAHISKETILSSESIKRLFGNVCTWLRGLLQ